MSLYANLPVLKFSEAAQAVAACVRAGRVPVLIGPPGVAKTVLAGVVAKAFEMELVTSILSNADPTDVAGLPMINPKSGNVELHLFPAFRAAAQRKVMLFLDELTAIRRSVEGPALRLTLERFAGDAPLHQDTRIIAACNPPEHAPGGIELSAALVNRLVWLRYEPSGPDLNGYYNARARGQVPENVQQATQEIRAMLTLDHNQFEREEFLDFAATMERSPDLMQLDPPPEAVAAGTPWGSPRAWECGISCYASLGREATSGKKDIIGYAVLAGSVGVGCSSAYLGIRDMRTQLPTVAEIVKDPVKSKLPTKELAVAAVGVLARVCEVDAGAAWMYAERLPTEVAAACYRPLSAHIDKLRSSKFGPAAMKAYTAASRRIGEMIISK